MFKKICSVLSGLLLVILLLLAAAFLLPQVLKYKEMAVLTGSMEPNIPVGSLIYVKETPPEELSVGDVITYRIGEDTVVTHRIVEIDPAAGTVKTKGDANDSNDAEPIPYGNVIGEEAFHLPLLGFISIYIKTPIGIAVVCGVLVLIILLTFLPEILTAEEEPAGENTGETEKEEKRQGKRKRRK